MTPSQSPHSSPFTNAPAIDAVAKQLAKLPGIGPRMAQRLTFALLKRKKEDIQELVEALKKLSDEVRPCSMCGNYSDRDPCHICSDRNRDHSVICVVEQPQDLFAIDRTQKFNGLYHVLGGALSPIDGIGPEEIGIPRLEQRLKPPVQEVIIATNPTIEGDATANYLHQVIKPKGMKVSRIARGLPSGSELEYADETTLAMAFSSRAEF